MTAFDFNPINLDNEFKEKGYLHIKSGVNKEFLKRVLTQAEQLVKNDGQMDEWTFAKKKLQYLFEFDSADELAEVKDSLATATGYNRSRFTLCERHLKIYSNEAAASPPPHKDRQASKITVGIPLKVPEGSFLQLYPHDVLDINHWGSSAEYRAGLDANQLPEELLKNIDPVFLDVQPGDIVIFKGSSIYHERLNPANTWLLYLKFNDENLDPIGEDYETPNRQQHSLAQINCLNDTELLTTKIEVSPRLDHVFRYYSRLNWNERLRAVVFGEHSVDISEFEFQLIRSVKQSITVRELMELMGIPESEIINQLSSLRRLVQANILELV